MTTQTAATDPGVFAEKVLGRSLWPYQREVAVSPARYRVICAGRQVGKSVLLATIALYEATTRRNILVMLVSAGEAASKRLLSDCVTVARSSPSMAGSVVDDSSSTLTLSNGSRIMSVPASAKQIRGWPVDLLIVDEAGFIDQQIWRAAEPAIIARPGSRVILASSPWGGADHFFRQLWNAGMLTTLDDKHLHSWHWPSSVSPMVDAVLLEQIRQREAPDYFAREYEAEWTDESGAYFSERELVSSVAAYPLRDAQAIVEWNRWVEGPGYVPTYPAAAGVDWGYSRDANAVALVAPLEDYGLNVERLGDRLVYFVPWLEARFQWDWSEFIGHLVALCNRAYMVRMVASETNGVGAYPTSDLRMRLFRNQGPGGHTAYVSKVWTDARRKQSGFGKIKGLLQRGQLVLPNHPELLKQLRALQFEQMQGGSIRIEVPERQGHDDLAMALMQAVSVVRPDTFRPWREAISTPGPVIETQGGIRVPEEALPMINADD